MSDKVLAQLAEMRDLSKAMTDRATNTQADFDTLSGRLQALESAFQGKTATAFDTQFVEWKKNAKAIVESLDGLGQFLKQAADAIQQTDEQLASGLG